MKHLLELAYYLLCVQHPNILCPIIICILELFQFHPANITDDPLFDRLLSPLSFIPNKLQRILINLFSGHFLQYLVDPSGDLSHHLHPLGLMMQEVLRMRLHLLVPLPVLLVHLGLHREQL